MSDALRRWYIPDAFIPEESTAPAVSHESICVLNPTDDDAHVVITVYFADKEPERSDVVVVPARRDIHMRTIIPEQVGGLRLASGVPYGIQVEADADVQVQYSRLDSTQAAYTLMTAMPQPQ